METLTEMSQSPCGGSQRVIRSQGPVLRKDLSERIIRS
jgi:hypothetical protein